ncbi:MAG: hypothetical protein FWC42_06140 [Proteobacteria bacterium]|nr:hypothetical protein [Pseudomonadota bacterium]
MEQMVPEPMQAHFQVSERDYLNAAFLHMRMTPRQWIMLALSALALTMC